MKARVKNYIEMRLSDLPEKLPEFIPFLRHGFPNFDDMLKDSRYIIRLSSPPGTVEIGYASDEWLELY